MEINSLLPLHCSALDVVEVTVDTICHEQVLCMIVEGVQSIVHIVLVP